MEDAAELLAHPRAYTKGCTGFRRSGWSGRDPDHPPAQSCM